jgi:hypothetical protein
MIQPMAESKAEQKHMIGRENTLIRHYAAIRTALMLLWSFSISGLAQAQLREGFVDPTITGPGIEALTELPGSAFRRLDHFAVVDPAERNGFLYVHLVGSGGLPENNLIFARHVAGLGFHVVSLAYPNWPSVRDLTLNSDDVTAPGGIREERLYGNDVSSLVEVDQPNSVVNRLTRLLEYLDEEFPAEGWARYLDGSEPVWSRLVIGGHSQGAGHAAYLGQDHALAGVLLLGGPGDVVPGVGVADWLNRPAMTPALRQFGFVHAEDPNYAVYQLTQTVLGLAMLGPVQDTDLLLPSEWTSHRLTSTRLDVPGGNYHGAVVVDGGLPLDADGRPVYAPVWDYMLGLPVFADSFAE